MENNSLLVELNDYPKIIFPLEGDREVLVGTAIFILSKINKIGISDGKIADIQSRISTIDLRYKNPVIKLD